MSFGLLVADDNLRPAETMSRPRSKSGPRTQKSKRSPNPGRFDFDVVIIGGGSGGYAAARTAAGCGLRTAVIEGGDEVGGLCILRGCMPTKALLYASEVMHLARHAEIWGVRTKGVGYDFAQVMARKNKLIKEFADFRREQLTDGRFSF